MGHGSLSKTDEDDIDIYRIIKLNALDNVEKTTFRKIRNVAIENDTNIECDSIPPTVVLNDELIVDYPYARYHHDDEDVLTNKNLFV